jgi:hypothetical protein
MDRMTESLHSATRTLTSFENVIAASTMSEADVLLLRTLCKPSWDSLIGCSLERHSLPVQFVASHRSNSLGFAGCSVSIPVIPCMIPSPMQIEEHDVSEKRS